MMHTGSSRHSPKSHYNQMLEMRDLVASLPDRLNPLLANGFSLTYARSFVHKRDGFGFYPRFRKAKEWPDLDSRVESFRAAITVQSELWTQFLNWWGAEENSQAKVQLLRVDNLKNISTQDLYSQLLNVMLTTPASWGDHHYWQIHQSKELDFKPFLATWNKSTLDDPWSLKVSRLEGEKLVEFGCAAVTTGSLPAGAEKLLSVFWEYLYPLCYREKFTPPQDPAKYATGTICELILPYFGPWPFNKKVRGWIMFHVDASSNHEMCLQSLSDQNFQTEWGKVQRGITCALKNPAQPLRRPLRKVP